MIRTCSNRHPQIAYAMYGDDGRLMDCPACALCDLIDKMSVQIEHLQTEISERQDDEEAVRRRVLDRIRDELAAELSKGKETR